MENPIKAFPRVDLGTKNGGCCTLFVIRHHRNDVTTPQLLCRTQARRCARPEMKTGYHD
jgi:hypothetical protein